MIEHVWFDVSGTLYRETPEYEEVHQAHIRDVFAEVTGETDPEQVNARYQELFEREGSVSSVFRALGKPADFWQQRFEAMDPGSMLQPSADITGTLAAIKNIAPISVFTNQRVASLLRLLGHLEIPADDFTHILSAVDLSRPKPDPEGFYKMVELSGVAPARTLYIGDSIKKDILPAKRVGMVTCLLWAKSDEADFSVETFPELLGVVQRA